MDEAAIQALLTTLARAHPSGGKVVERAAVMAAGSDSPQVLAWISDHGGRPEMAVRTSSAGGLHGSRFTTASAGGEQTPLRYVFEASVLA